MKILHLCLSCFYIDGYSYQENQLVAQNVADGHEVFVIASTETFDEDRNLTYTKPGSYMGKDGAPVVRLPYRRFFPHFIMKKIRAYKGLYPLLKRINPDVILFHGMCAWELKSVARFVRNNPHVKLYVDSHEDFNNSARGFVSKELLHGMFYRPILKHALPVIQKVLCISEETVAFVKGFYRVPVDKIEFFPLGGLVFDDSTYLSLRTRARERYNIASQDILLVQSGKMGRSKKLIESLTAFSSLKDQGVRFIVVGHLLDEIAEEALALIEKDLRIQFIGWKDADELQEILCAADIYLQPGTQSATMQMSLCCRCSVILDDVESHRVFVNGNGWLLNDGLDIQEALLEMINRRKDLPVMNSVSADIANRLLDYKLLAARLYR